MAVATLAASFHASASSQFDWKAVRRGGVLNIHVTNRAPIPVTLQVACIAGNAPAISAAYVVEAPPNATASKEFHFPKSASLPDKTHCKFSGEAGYASTKASKALYRIPFAVKRGICVGQAPGAVLTTHRDEPSSLQAIDFLLNEGEPVVAAADGVVFEAVDGFDRGGPAPSNRSKTNYVEIVHADGAMTEYAHLLKGSVRVKHYQRVHAGEIIGYAGMSGQAEGPHLHFAVGHPMLISDPITGISTLQGMISVPANFEIGGRPVQVHLGGFISSSETQPTYEAASGHCRKP